MKIGVISDIHENFHNLILSLERMEKEGVERIICLGDLINAGVAKLLAIQNVPVHMIWGNNDGEKTDIVNAAHRKGSNLTVALNVYDFLEVDGRQIFISHYDDLAEPMAKSGLYDAVFYGHNHTKDKKYIGQTLVVNPGELCAQKTGVCTLAIYDTVTNDAQIITVENSITLKSDVVTRYMQEHAEKLSFRSQNVFEGDHD